jgi:hypothetical protein
MSTVSLNLVNDSVTANFYIEGTTAGPTVGNVALLNLDGNSSNVLRGDGSWGVGGGGGTATVAGADTQLQYNNAGALGAITGVTSNGVAITAAIANVKLTGGVASQFISTDGTGNLSFSTIPGYVQTPRVELIAPAVSTQNYTWTHPSFAYYDDDASLMNIFSMGVLTDKDKWSLSGTTLTYNAWTLPNGQYDVLPGVVATGAASGSVTSVDTINANIITANSVTSVRLAGEGGNISNIQTPVISNSTTYARTYSDGHFRVAINNGLKMMIDSDGVEITGALVPAANITYDLGTATRRWKDLYLSNNTIYLNDVSLSADANGLNVGGSTMATEDFVGNSINALGNIRTVNLDGNVSNVLSGNGSWVQNKTAGGNTREVQFNSGGTLSGSPKLTYDGNTLSSWSEADSTTSAAAAIISLASSNVLGAAFATARTRGTKTDPLPLAVNDTIGAITFNTYTGNGNYTVNGLSGFSPTRTSIISRVEGLPSADNLPPSSSLQFIVTSNTSASIRTPLIINYNAVTIAVNSANSNVYIVGNSANSNVYIVGSSANSNVSIAGNSANSNVSIAGNSANSNVYIAPISANSNVSIAPADNATIRIGGGANTKIIMHTQNVPATSTSTGTVGQVAFDQNYIYYCWATDQWKRSPLSTW